MAFGLVDFRLRPNNTPTKEQFDQYFNLNVFGVERVPEDESGVGETPSIPFHPCTQADKAQFYKLSELNASKVDAIWEKMFCLDDPSQLKFQGGVDLDYERTFNLQLSPTTAATQADALFKDFTKNKVFLTVYNDNSYM